TAARQEFPVGASSVAMFHAAGLQASLRNTWAMEIEPGRRFRYELSRPDARLFQVDFDLSTPVEPPPAPWGAGTPRRARPPLPCLPARIASVPTLAGPRTRVACPGYGIRSPVLRHPPHHAPLVWLAPATPAGHDRGRTQRGEGNMQITPSPVTAAAAGVVSALVMTALWPRLGDDSLYWVLAFLLVIALPVHVFVVGFGRARPASSADPAMIRRVAVWLVAGLATVGIGLLFGR